MQPSLALVVPDPDRLVQGAGSYDGLADAHVHARHLPVVEGVGEVVERRRTSTTALGREEGRGRRGGGGGRRRGGGRGEGRGGRGEGGEGGGREGSNWLLASCILQACI